MSLSMPTWMSDCHPCRLLTEHACSPKFHHVTSNMQVRERPNTQVPTQAVLRLRMEQFDLMTRLLGCESDTARAELIGVTYRTIWRARKPLDRDQPQSHDKLIAQAVANLRLHADELAKYGLHPTLDSLSEVIDLVGVGAAA